MEEPAHLLPQQGADQESRHGPKHAGGTADRRQSEPLASVAEYQWHQQHVGGNRKEAALCETQHEQRQRRGGAVCPCERPVIHPAMQMIPWHMAFCSQRLAAVLAILRFGRYFHSATRAGGFLLFYIADFDSPGRR